ncbi:hypothetical protein HYW39_02575 [Candidatus Curtissbacteria bacterium]|nr:hypothetical protein [Candidatus Curtissbacteria bacterium]
MVILTLAILIIFRHKSAIDDRIRHLESLGKDGAKFGPDRSEKKGIATNELPLPREDEKSKKAIVSSSNIALVECRVASSLPGTVTFNFLRDWKVWFWIGNREPKKYKAYVKIKFIADSLEREVPEGYYGGTQAWKLDAFSGIQAPGLEIPEEIKRSAQEGKRIKIEINCEVKDENDNLIEKKFPQTYSYDSQNNSWFLEP